MRKIMFAVLAALCLVLPALGQDPESTYGPGAPTSQNPVPSCTQFKRYRDTITGNLWQSIGVPCSWTLTALPGLTPPIPANWTTFGANCTNSTTTTVAGITALQVIGQSGTTNTCGVKAAASGNFTHIFIINAAVNAASNSGILVGFTDGTKYETCGVGYNNGAIQVTAISSATLTGAVAAANGSVSNAPVTNGFPYYFRLTSSGSTLSCDYSPDQGNNWVNIFTDAVPFLTVSNVFFGANNRNATGTPYGWLLSYQ